MTAKKSAGKAGGKAGTFAKGHDPRRNVTVPGPGAPPSAVRAAMRDAYAVRLPKLAKLADHRDPDIALKAMLQLGRFGLGPARAVNEDDVRDRLRDTLAAIRAMVPADVLPQLEAKLADIWMGRPIARLQSGDAA